MITILERDTSQRRSIAPGEPIPDATVWIDLLRPSKEEEEYVEAFLGHDIPTLEEMAEIEASSRLYKHEGASFMTATVLSVSGRELPVGEPVTFILSGNRLTTVRYHDASPFRTFAALLAQHKAPQSGPALLQSLLEVIVDRLADIHEEAGADLDRVSAALFSKREGIKAGQMTATYHNVLREIGLINSRVSKAQESLRSLSRLQSFARLGEAGGVHAEDVETLREDLRSLIEENGFLYSKIAFSLDACMGLISNEQTSIIKIFSVIAVIFLPPTVVASAYGMNFRHMPELDWTFGYPLALLLMAISAIGPYWFFKSKNWL